MNGRGLAHDTFTSIPYTSVPLREGGMTKKTITGPTCGDSRGTRFLTLLWPACQTRKLQLVADYTCGWLD